MMIGKKILRSPAQALAMAGCDYYEVRIGDRTVFECNHIDRALDAWNQWKTEPDVVLMKNGTVLLPKADTVQPGD